MTQLHLMTVMGTRPEIIRLSEIIRCCDRYFRQTLFTPGRIGMRRCIKSFSGSGLRPPDVQLHVAGAHLGQTLGNILAQSFALMQELRPDALLILGDTNSCLSAISARRLQIPIFHLEAGNRCFDGRVPEEVNRRIVDVTADFNLCYTEHARRNLLASGLPPERIFVVGSPMPEVLLKNLPRIRASRVMERLGLEDRAIFSSRPIGRRTSTRRIVFCPYGGGQCPGRNVRQAHLICLSPPGAANSGAAGCPSPSLVRVHPPLGFHDYNQLQLHAYCVLSDSGTLPEESSFFRGQGLSFPAVCLRTSTERPEALERGAFLLAGVQVDQVLAAVKTAVTMAKGQDWGTMAEDYRNGKISDQVASIIQSYAGLFSGK